MTLERRGVGNGMHAVEGMRKVDEAALLPDRSHCLRERHAAWDLLSEEQADHLSLPVGLHLFALDDDELVVACERTRLERAAEHVVIRHSDRTESDRLRV